MKKVIYPRSLYTQDLKRKVISNKIFELTYENEASKRLIEETGRLKKKKTNEKCGDQPGRLPLNKWFRLVGKLVAYFTRERRYGGGASCVNVNFFFIFNLDNLLDSTNAILIRPAGIHLITPSAFSLLCQLAYSLDCQTNCLCSRTRTKKRFSITIHNKRDQVSFRQCILTYKAIWQRD